MKTEELLDIQESEKELIRLYRKQNKLLQRQRVEALLLLKRQKVKTVAQLAEKLKRDRKTIYTWLTLYRSKGLNFYLQIKSRGKRKEVISAIIKEGIGKILSDSHPSITSYVELQAWIASEYGVEVNYKTLYSHCHIHHKSRLKVARKSHYKKDEQAVKTFKKNYQNS